MTKKRKPKAIFVLLLVFLGYLLFTNSSYSQDSPSSSENVTFDGYIYNAKTKEVIENAEIKIQPNEADVMILEKRSTAGTTFSNPKGYYKITCSPNKDNQYTILICASNFISKCAALSGDNRQNNFSLIPHESGCLIKTLYLGNQLYIRKGHLFYLVGGYTNRDESYFKDLHLSNEVIDSFLKSIGIKYTKPKNDEEIWSIVTTVWDTLGRIWKDDFPENVGEFITYNDKGEYTGLPSIERMAQTFEKFGFLPKLNCLYNAHDFVTLSVRAGVPINKIAISDCKYTFAATPWTHYAVILYIKNNWYYFDSTYRYKILPKYEYLTSLPEKRSGYDYIHPRFIIPIPGSSLAGVPLVSADYKIPGIDPLNAAEAYISRARMWSQQKRNDETIADYNEGIKLKPDYPNLYLNRGYEWFRMKEYDKAIADFSETIELKPDYVQAYWPRASAWIIKEEYDKAIADYSKIVQLSPNYALAYYSRGKAWHKKREFDKAISDYEKSMILDPRGKGQIEPLLNKARAKEEL